MANLLAVVGKPGSGKSSSGLPDNSVGRIGLVPEETVYLNITGKPLPARGSGRMFPKGNKISSGARDIHTSDPEEIAKIIRVIDSSADYAHLKNIVIDDAQYLQMFTFMDKIKEKGYDKFNDTGEAAYLPLKAACNAKRTDLNIIFTYHLEKEDGETKIKTAGRLVDAYLTIEGLFTVVLFTKVVHDPTKSTNAYYFQTQTDGMSTAKSPPGMFETFLIPNDLGFVLRKMQEYYE